MGDGDFRERIYDVFAATDEPVEDRIEAALEVGRTALELPIGFRTDIETGTQRIEQVVGDHHAIQPGETCPLDRAYCRRTIERDSPLAVQDAGGSAAISSAAIETFGLATYIGARVEVDDEVVGTICFADGAVREAPFAGAETHLVELIARLTGQALERRAYTQALEARERALDEREEIYRAVLDASFDLVFRIDDEGRFSFVSQAVEELIGYPPERFIDEPFQSLLPDEETREAAASLYERVMAGETVAEYYFPLEHRAGDPVYVDIRVTPIYDPAVPDADRTPSSIVGVQGTARDAGDRRRSEHLIRVLNRVLRHNLRNDMNVIGGYADLLIDELEGEAATRLERIRETSSRLSRLAETAQRLETNLTTPAEVGPIDLVPILRQVADRAATAYPDVTIGVDAPDRAMAIGAGRIETALEELLENAAQHAGGDPHIELGCTVESETITVTVADDGPGLPEQERSVLEAGDETPLVHGSGLGLWLVHWIVEGLDGQLTVLETGSGTKIELRLRRAGAGPG